MGKMCIWESAELGEDNIMFGEVRFFFIVGYMNLFIVILSLFSALTAAGEKAASEPLKNLKCLPVCIGTNSDSETETHFLLVSSLAKWSLKMT